MEEVLNQLRKVRKVDVSPFFMTRIRAKISAAEAEQLPPLWFWAGTVAAGCLLWLNYQHAFQPPPGNIAAELGLHQAAQIYADKK